MTQRERELQEENRRLREANRRLQVTGVALERDKLIRQLRAQVALLLEENEHLRESWQMLLRFAFTFVNFALAASYWFIWLVWRLYCWTVWWR